MKWIQTNRNGWSSPMILHIRWLPWVELKTHLLISYCHRQMLQKQMFIQIKFLLVIFHNNGVIWVVWRLKTPAISLMVPQLVQGNNKENVKAPIFIDILVGKCTGNRRIPITKSLKIKREPRKYFLYVLFSKMIVKSLRPSNAYICQ